MGELLAIDDDHRAIIMTGGVGYGISLAPVTAVAWADQVGQRVCVYTVHYIQGAVGTGSLVPTLVGFQHPDEREFYRLLLQVGGLGPRGALRAMSQPPAAIARAIASGDRTFLQQLPGVGGRRAGNIVQQLRDKVGAFVHGPAAEPIAGESGGGSGARSADGSPGVYSSGRNDGSHAGANGSTDGSPDSRKDGPIAGPPQGPLQGLPPDGPHGGPADRQEEVMAVLKQLGYGDRDAQRMVAAALQRRNAPATTEELIAAIFQRPKGGVAP